MNEVLAWFYCLVKNLLFYHIYIFYFWKWYNNQAQSQRDYLPSLDISINEAKQQSSTLHIGAHILSESSKDNTQNPKTHYQLTSHLQSNTLELDDKAQILSYEHYYPDEGSAPIGVVVFVAEGLGFVVQL